MQWTMDLQPLVPVWLAIALAAITALVAIAGLLARTRGAFLRALSGAVLALAVFNPVMLREERENLPDIAVLVTDRSQSQTIGDRASPERCCGSRTAQTAWLALQTLKCAR